MNLVRHEIFVEHFEEIGDYEMAEYLLQQLIQFRNRNFPAQAKELIYDYYNLALVQEAQDKSNEAFASARKAFFIALEHQPSKKVSIFEISQLIEQLYRTEVA